MLRGKGRDNPAEFALHSRTPRPSFPPIIHEPARSCEQVHAKRKSKQRWDSRVDVEQKYPTPEIAWARTKTYCLYVPALLQLPEGGSDHVFVHPRGFSRTTLPLMTFKSFLDDDTPSLIMQLRSYLVPNLERPSL